MARSFRVLKVAGYWVWLIVLVIVGVYLPYKIIWWIPNVSTLTRETWSAGIRFFLAYLLLISSWVALLLVVGTRAEQEDSKSIVLAEDSGGK